MTVATTTLTAIELPLRIRVYLDHSFIISFVSGEQFSNYSSSISGRRFAYADRLGGGKADMLLKFSALIKDGVDFSTMT